MPHKTPIGTRAPYKKVFRDPDLLNEMLDLARLGKSWSELARRYRVDHTSIIWRCKTAGITLQDKATVKKNILLGVFGNMEQSPARRALLNKLRRDILNLILKDKMLIEDIADLYSITVDTIVSYFEQNKINIEEVYIKAKMDPGVGYFTEDGKPRWRKDKIEGKICLGKSRRGRDQELKNREIERMKKKREELLSF